MSQSRITLTVADHAFQPLGILRDWDTATMVERYCDVGTGKADCDSSDWNLDLVSMPGRNIIVRNENRIIQAGPLPKFKELLGADGQLQLTWQDSVAFLARKLALPAPHLRADGTLPVESDDRSGPTGSVIMGYVSDNMGPTARPDRRLRGLVMGPDLGAGLRLAAAYQARFTNLLTMSQQLAVAGEVQFWFELEDRSLVFKVRNIQDLSESVVFSPHMHGVESLSVEIEGPQSTVVFVGGKGEGAARVFAEVQTRASVEDEAAWGRFETFRDDRSAEPDSMRAGAERDLSEKGSTVTASFAPVNNNMRYGRDYFLGDLVTCRYRDLMVVKPVREVTTTVTANGDVTTAPVAGDFAGTAFQQRDLIRTVEAFKRNR